MIPDILGYNIEDAVTFLSACGINKNDIIIHEYLSPKFDKVGNDRRILRVTEEDGRIIIIVSYF